MHRVARRCCKCWSVLIAVLIALTSILLGALLSVPPEYKTYHFTPITPPTKVLLFGASGATGQVRTRSIWSPFSFFAQIRKGNCG